MTVVTIAGFALFGLLIVAGVINNFGYLCAAWRACRHAKEGQRIAYLAKLAHFSPKAAAMHLNEGGLADHALVVERMRRGTWLLLAAFAAFALVMILMVAHLHSGTALNGG